MHAHTHTQLSLAPYKRHMQGQGPPPREPVVSEAERGAMMAYYFKRQEELKVKRGKDGCDSACMHACLLGLSPPSHDSPTMHSPRRCSAWRRRRRATATHTWHPSGRTVRASSAPFVGSWPCGPRVWVGRPGEDEEVKTHIAVEGGEQENGKAMRFFLLEAPAALVVCFSSCSFGFFLLHYSSNIKSYSFMLLCVCSYLCSCR